MPKKNIDYNYLWHNLKKYLIRRVREEPIGLVDMSGVTAFDVVLTIMDYSETVIISKPNN